MSVFRPTHSCFDDAMEFLEHRVKLEPGLARARSLVLVHAICLAPDGPQKGTPFAHAWVEELMAGSVAEWFVWESGLLDGKRSTFAVTRESHRAGLQVQDETRYTLHDVLRENTRTGTFGPWEEKYRALCRHGDAPPVVFTEEQDP